MWPACTASAMPRSDSSRAKTIVAGDPTGVPVTSPALELPPLQPVRRDFAFTVPDTVPADAVLRAARGAERNLITGASIFDVYQGPGVPEGQKSVAVEVVLQPRERTLTDAEIEAVAAKVVAAVAKATGGAIR